MLLAVPCYLADSLLLPPQLLLLMILVLGIVDMLSYMANARSASVCMLGFILHCKDIRRSQQCKTP